MKKLTLLLLIATGSVFAQKGTGYADKKAWTDSVYNSLSTEQRIGQLFMVAAYSNKNEAHFKSLDKLVQEQQVGGVIFFQGGPVRQAVLNNRLQALSKVPMMVGIDGEWGLSMRLDSTYRFPFNMTLGAVQDMSLIESLGKATAKQAKRLGIQFNFGPVVDVNINPANPIIGVRSYGETRDIVTNRAVAFTKGYQSEGIFATAKHFPGHGDTSTDSHHALPVIPFDEDRMNKIELYPYKELIKNDLSSVMVAHLNVSAFEPDDKLPSSLSYNIVTKLLREQLGFEGLIFTDALNMKAASNYLKPGEVDLAAFKAGNDLLLFPEDVPTAAAKIKAALEAGEITEERLAYSVKKVLEYKYKAGVTKFKPVEKANLKEDLNASEYDDLNTKLYNEAMTLVKNEDHILPIKHLEREKVAYLKLGDDDGSNFLTMLSNYTEVQEITPGQIDSLPANTTLVIGYHKVDNPWRNHNLSDTEKQVIKRASEKYKTVLVSFAKPYVLSALSNPEKLSAVIVAYQNNKFANNAAAQIIFGALGAKGKLPVSIGNYYTVGTGLKTRPIKRLGFSTPGNEGMDLKKLEEIDKLAEKAIKDKLTPGLQVVIARHGNIVYQKSFGFHTYAKQTKVQNTDLYDLASLTKILGSLPILMKMYDTGKIKMDSKLGDMVPVFKNSDKANITFKELMLHQAGLVAWIPFYKATLDANNKPDAQWYKLGYSEEYPTQVSENLFLKKNYTEVMLQTIADSKLDSKKEYKYSDLGFIALKEMIESKYKKSLDEVIQEEYFKKIGASRMTYNPLRKFDIGIIPPTEEDKYYRYTTVQGYVHDMGAAMQGGVSGHAGLFGTALDVTKMMQMYLNKGEYGDDNFFSNRTFDTFNDCVNCKDGSRRGIGFDKPQKPGTSGPTCGCASLVSFGHTGFTGTIAWADPENELIYVFLSNRSYPDSNVNNLSKQGIREKIQKVVYDAIVK
ncbi:MAG: serine hydrolase [Flavobacteriaceae bacterium]|jgi:beta-glucosidase-like glycosyl hydrolase/CubicO group peptidase (beta-lactamase class C family)|nr:serine hydrolase [Flavobacteriaceae bacterium]